MSFLRVPHRLLSQQEQKIQLGDILIVTSDLSTVGGVSFVITDVTWNFNECHLLSIRRGWRYDSTISGRRTCLLLHNSDVDYATQRERWLSGIVSGGVELVEHGFRPLEVVLSPFRILFAFFLEIFFDFGDT